jgi:hypothetical protein
MPVQKKNVSDKKLLDAKGWRHDGLWWHSPYSSHRYMIREAVSVEELRAWGASESAFLKDRNHSMWVKKEEEDYALVSQEEAADMARQEQHVKQLGKDSNYGKNKH